MANKNYKIDLHTHSIISHDGGISKKQYTRILEEGILDYIAITDHNETGFAKNLNNELGSRVIVGEEISTVDGEMIGLFLEKTIPSGLSAGDTVNEIKSNGGLVYIPHPFETRRKGLQEEILKSIINDVDIIEVFNGRGFIRGKPQKAHAIATSEKVAMAAGSDAHCRLGIGSAFSTIHEIPSDKSLASLLKKGELQKKYAPMISLLCPSVNKIKNKLVLGL